jgi:hypothetical protein
MAYRIRSFSKIWKRLHVGTLKIMHAREKLDVVLDWAEATRMRLVIRVPSLRNRYSNISNNRLNRILSESTKHPLNAGSQPPPYIVFP